MAAQAEPRHVPSLGRLGLVLGLAAMLGGCGGNVDQVDPFVAKRVVVLGDELSLVANDGRRHGINQLDGNGDPVCTSLPVWTQSVASRFGFGFPGCPTGAGNSAGVMRAEPGVRAAGLAAQVDANTFGAGDLVTLSIGLNDVRAQFARLGEPSPPAFGELVDAARSAGAVAAVQACRVLATGARLLLATAPDLGLSPRGRAGGATSATQLTQLGEAFTTELRVRVAECRVGGAPVDGSTWGLIDGQEKIRLTVQSPQVFGGLSNPSNVTDAACADGVAADACTTATLKAGASAGAWLWAGETLPGPAWHRLVDAGFRNIAFFPR